jgi:hypothetical protein
MTVKDWAQLIAAATVSSSIVTGLFFVYTWAVNR